MEGMQESRQVQCQERRSIEGHPEICVCTCAVSNTKLRPTEKTGCCNQPTILRPSVITPAPPHRNRTARECHHRCSRPSTHWTLPSDIRHNRMDHHATKPHYKPPYVLTIWRGKEQRRNKQVGAPPFGKQPGGGIRQQGGSTRAKGVAGECDALGCAGG